MGARGYKPLRRQRAISQIEELIARRELWGRRLPGEREMATELGISRGTLQKALELLEARGAVVRKHGSGTYAAERDAQGRREGWRGSRVCLLVPAQFIPRGTGWSYYGDMLAGAERGARRADMEMAILPLEEFWAVGPASSWSRLKEYDAHIVVERDDYALMSALLRLRRGPVVCLDSYFRDVPVVGVVDGSFEGARRAVGYMLRAGHRRIGYIAPGETADSPHEKTQGYRAALTEAGVAPRSELMGSPGYDDVAGGVRAAVESFLALNEPPTAIFAATDRRALVVLDTLEGSGLRVGKDVALMGFGDSAFRLGSCDRLSSVRIHTRQMGEAAVRAVLDYGGAAEGRTVIVPDRLVIRQTTCKAPASVGR